MSPIKLKTVITDGGTVLRPVLPFNGPRIVLSLKDAGDMGYSEDGTTPGRNKFLGSLGIDGGKVVSCIQIHSKNVCLVDLPVQHAVEGDGVVTGNRDLFLGVSAADCMPVFIVDTRKGSFGVVHSGWKGTGILENALDIFLNDLEAARDDIAVILGPSAGACCYEVDKERSLVFSRKWGSRTVVERDGSFFLNLPAANEVILERRGISAVYEFHECTICNAQYGSFRREGPDDYTRMLALIGYFE